VSAVTYIGEFPADADSIEQYGYTFERGKSVNVTDKQHLAKLSANRFFKTVDSDKSEIQAAEEEAEQAEIQTLQGYLRSEGVPFHHRQGLSSLRDLKDKHEAAKAKALED
jgi:hypothetical protein